MISHRLLVDQTLLLAAAHAESISSGDGYLVTFRSMGYRHTLTCRMIIDTVIGQAAVNGFDFTVK